MSEAASTFKHALQKLHATSSSDGAKTAPNVEPVSVNPQTFSLPNSGLPPETAEPIRQQEQTEKVTRWRRQAQHNRQSAA